MRRPPEIGSNSSLSPPAIILASLVRSVKNRWTPPLCAIGFTNGRGRPISSWLVSCKRERKASPWSMELLAGGKSLPSWSWAVVAWWLARPTTNHDNCDPGSAAPWRGWKLCFRPLFKPSNGPYSSRWPTPSEMGPVPPSRTSLRTGNASPAGRTISPARPTRTAGRNWTSWLGISFYRSTPRRLRWWRPREAKEKEWMHPAGIRRKCQEKKGKTSLREGGPAIKLIEAMRPAAAGALACQPLEAQGVYIIQRRFLSSIFRPSFCVRLQSIVAFLFVSFIGWGCLLIFHETCFCPSIQLSCRNHQFLFFFCCTLCQAGALPPPERAGAVYLSTWILDKRQRQREKLPGLSNCCGKSVFFFSLFIN